MKDREFYLERRYHEKLGKCNDTSQFFTVDRETARELVKKVGKTLRNLGRLSPIVVEAVEERGMVVRTILWRM